MPKCLRCQKEVSASTVLCKECRKEFKGAKPYQRKRKPKILNTQCKTCKYRYRVQSNVNEYLCDYLSIVGHMRPCEPSPNCTVYERIREKKNET